MFVIPPLPMPGETHGGVVIASQWGNDDPGDGTVWCTAILLAPQPPYYEVVEFVLRDGGWEPAASHGTARNIREAVELYENNN